MLNGLKFIVVYLFLSSLVMAQISTELRTRLDHRYDSRLSGDVQRLQERLRVGVRLDFDKKFQIIGDLSTGATYGSDWSTIKVFKPDSNTNNSYRFPELNLRRLYIQRDDNNYRFQLGVIPTIKKYTSFTGKDQSGWIDGARIEKKFNKSYIEVVAGSIGDLTTPNPFERQWEFNFAEIEYSRELTENLSSEVTFEHIFNDNLGQIEFKYDIDGPAKEIVSLSSDALYNFDTEGLGFGVGIEMDLLLALLKRYPAYLIIEVEYLNIDEKLGQRGTLNDGFNGFGEQLVLAARGAITKNNNIAWFTRAFLGEENRFNAGINIRFDKKFASKSKEQ